MMRDELIAEIKAAVDHMAKRAMADRIDFRAYSAGVNRGLADMAEIVLEHLAATKANQTLFKDMLLSLSFSEWNYDLACILAGADDTEIRAGVTPRGCKDKDVQLAFDYAYELRRKELLAMN